MAKIIIKGLQELDTAFKKFVFNMDQAIDDAVRITAFKVLITATQDIREPSAGKLVTRYKRDKEGRHIKGSKPRKHIQSKKGDAPNTDTGRLIGSIIVDHHKGDQVAFVGTNLDYGLFLETTHNRPWLEPAKVKEVKFFSNNIANAMDSQIKKADQ